MKLATMVEITENNLHQLHNLKRSQETGIQIEKKIEHVGIYMFSGGTNYIKLTSKGNNEL